MHWTAFEDRLDLIPARAASCFELSSCRLLLRSPTDLLFYLGERVQGQVTGIRVVPDHPPVDMCFGARISGQEALILGTSATPFLLDEGDYDEFCYLHLMPHEIPTRGFVRGRQTPTHGAHSSHGSVSQATMGTSHVGASSSSSGLDASFWAPDHVDYFGTGSEMARYEIPVAFPSDYRPLPEDVSQVFFFLLFFLSILSCHSECLDGNCSCRFLLTGLGMLMT